MSRKEPFCLPLTQPPLKVQQVSQGQQPSVPALDSPQEFPANLQKIQDKFSDVIQVHFSYKSSKVKELHSNYILFMKGRLKRHVKYWRDIGTSQMILSVISDEYKIHFIEHPPSMFLCNNHSAINDAEFVTESILELLASGRITETFCSPYYFESGICNHSDI